MHTSALRFRWGSSWRNTRQEPRGFPRLLLGMPALPPVMHGERCPQMLRTWPFILAVEVERVKSGEEEG